MSSIDWIIVALPLALVVAVGLRTRRSIRNPTDFLAAGRSAGRYLVCNAEGTASMGAVTIIANFEMYYRSGWAVGWWATLSIPVSLIVVLSGFVIYRYRETRCLTLAEFFERRYSRRFRIFMGFLAFIAGILNYGIFPAVGAKFVVYFCGFPTAIHVLGTPLPTYSLIMAALVGTNLAFALSGGQLTAMVVDCIEGIVSGILFLVVAVAVLHSFTLRQMHEALTARPAGQSFVDPFDTGKLSDFNIWYFLIAIVGSVYTMMAWQGNQGFNASAINPHEARMGKILGSLRMYARGLMVSLTALFAYIYLHHGMFAAHAVATQQALSKITEPQIREQMTVPVLLGNALPVGAKGAFLAIMIFAMIATDTSYMHSWGSIFVQDVLRPLRRKPLTARQHLLWLRLAIAGVAVFAFSFSLFYRQTDYILMFFAVTGAIYLGGAGSVIIGGLYWRKGTTTAAWVSMCVGSGLAVAGIVLQQTPAARFINGQYMYFLSMVAAVLAYGIVSVLTCTMEFNLDQLMHRGQYAVDADGNLLPEPEKPPRNWKSLLGIDENFSMSDRFQSAALFGWSMLWFVIFIVAVAWNLIARWPTNWWFWYMVYTVIALPLAVSFIMIVWFTWGGIRDMRRLFAALATARGDESMEGGRESIEAGASPGEDSALLTPIKFQSPLAQTLGDNPPTGV